MSAMLSGLRPVTVALAAIAVGITFLSMRPDASQEWEALNWLGYFSPTQIWDGAWWAYLSTVFLHVGLFHLGFNLYWLWLFGSVLEDRLGSLGFLGVAALTAFVGSGFQFAATGTTGVGLSGVGYGLFGYSWLRSRFDPGYTLRPDVVRLFVAWFFIAILLDAMGVMPIANWAHGGGFVAGATLAMAQRGRGAKWRLGGALGLVASLTFSLTPFFAQPWSIDWLRHTALAHQKAEDNERALEYYDRVLARDPTDAWAMFNRGVAHQDLGHAREARRDFERACELDQQYCR